MFNNMKNKIREKTGGDLPKFVSNYNKVKNSYHSRQSSISSLSSITSEQSWKEDGELNNKTSLQPDVESIKSINEANEDSASNKSEFSDNSKVSNLSIDWGKKYFEKEQEWKDKEKIYVSDLLKQTKELKATISLVEENRKKYQHCQEEKDQLELYQKEEMSRIKQLLLSKEEENNTNASLLKDALSTINTLKLEICRLRPFEEQVNSCQDDLECLRHTSEKERWNLTSQLAQHEETIRHLHERVAVLTHRTESDCQALGAQLSSDERVQSLLAERVLLERRLEEAHIHLSEIKTSWSNKIAILETQVGRLSRQAGEEGLERRKAECRIGELEQTLEQMEKEKEVIQKTVEKLQRERDSLAQELKTIINDRGGDVDVENETKEKYNALLADLEQLNNRYLLLEKSLIEAEKNYEDALCVEKEKNTELNIEVNQLKDSNIKLKSDLESECNMKDKTILRNAQISQKGQLAEQELEREKIQNEELCKKITHLEELLQSSKRTIKEQKQQLEEQNNNHNAAVEEQLTEKIKEMEMEIADKNKSIKVLQQKLIDMKKTLQEELKNADNGTTAKTNCSAYSPESDINFKYMKHVLIKFLTSSEYEAQHLTKVVSTLLHLNAEEERLLTETLDWRMSWFGIRPRFKSRVQNLS